MFDLMPFDRKRRRDSLEKFFDHDFLGDSLGFESLIKADIKENDQEYIVEAEVPGLDKEDIEIEVKDDQLTIRAEYAEEIKEEEENYIRKERKTGSYSRQFYIYNVDQENIKAECEDGLLTIVLPKLKKKDKNGKMIDID